MRLVERVPEPELMDDRDQALAYAAADFSEPHDAFVAAFATRFPEFAGGRVVDLGCGTGDVTVRFARAYPNTRILGVDGAAAMLDCATRIVHDAGMEARIELRRTRLPDSELRGAGPFDAVISNSLLHHLADPSVLWTAVEECAAHDAPVFVMDLLRPDSTEAARALVDRYAADEHPLLRADFEASLCAAYTLEEISAQLARAGFPLRVDLVSDRHVVVWGRRDER
jgi:2-polyprenyl-3-methyl-5-hydroxy-6-metoxy-1,4-benzoquinol methylase